MILHSLEEAEQRASIHERLARFTPEARRRWGTLSVAGAMCHLAYSYELVPDPTAVITQRTGPLQRSLFRYLSLRLPVRWPPSYPTLPELVEGAPGVRSQGFDRDLERLIAAYEAFLAAPDLAGRAHPIFGPLTQWEWMRWGYLHADHHLRQFGL